MDSKVLKPISETKYLSAENTWRYRAIMRTFYLFDQQYRHWLSKEDVYQALAKEAAFSDYTQEMCAQDLENLNHWGNLNAVQDTSKVMTYQQFVNKQFRYQMTEYAIEVERMTLRLENLVVEGGSLEPTLMERLKEQIQMISKQLEEPLNKVGGWWSALTSDFERLNQSYQDYIRDWSGAKAEELMKTKHFLLYKEKLVEYLRYFIKALQSYGEEIELLLRQVTEKQKQTLIERITNYEMEIPRVDMEQLNREELKKNIAGRFESLQSFFVGTKTSDSEVETILAMTNEIIRKVTRYAATILEQANQYSGRKEEYIKIATLFLEQENVRKAHELSARVFGVSAYKHFIGDMERETEKIHSSIYEENPITVVTNPKIRNFREKLQKNAIKDRTEEKKQMREQVLKERAFEKEVLFSYVQAGKIVMDELGEVSENVRRTLLRWISKALVEMGSEVSTEHGQKYRLINPDESKRCRLKASDGEMEMPAYILQFKEQ
ncbi:MAG TPA: TIGR02677 family protein [Eubacteriaceae bacterium]|nr:TIGR02677 family protein [Eubacteriaceae bacterium]